MFTTRTYNSKNGLKKRTNVEIDLADLNIKATAWIGVISQDRGIFYYETHPNSINSNKFIKFL